MKNPQRLLLFVVILIIFSYLIYALEGYIDVTKPQPEKPAEKEKTILQ